MPVNRPKQTGHIGRSRRRISATSLTTFQRCPGQWLLKTQVGLQQKISAPMVLGHVLEDAIISLLMKHPPLCRTEEELNAWCMNQIDELVEQAVENFDERVSVMPTTTISIESSEPDAEEIHRRIENGVNLIFSEVKRCVEQNGGPYLDAYRKGQQVFDVPAPSHGLEPTFPYPEYVQSHIHYTPTEHPSWAKDGEVTWNEAWEISRPWFKDPRISQPQRLFHPDDWASGELDLVYRWDGHIHIIDIKSGRSSSPFASSLQTQLEFYSWLWYHCFDKSLPTKISGWYLGDAKEVEYDALTSDDMEKMDVLYWSIHQEMKSLTQGIVLFPLPKELACDGEAAGCSWCSAKLNKEVLTLKTHNSHTEIQRPKKAESPYQMISSIDSKVDVRGKLSGGWGPLPNHFGEYVLGAILVVGEQHVVVEENEPGVFPTLHQHLDSEIMIKGASSGVWRNQPRLYLDDSTIISTIEQETTTTFTRLGLLQTRANIQGTILSSSYQKGIRMNGKPWSMLAFSIWDGEHVVELVAFGSSISTTLKELQIGSQVKIMSAEIGWRNGLLQLRFDSRKTRIDVQET